MKKSFLAAFCLLLSAFSVSAEEQRPVLVLEVKGAIDPAVARYVLRGLEEARRLQASAVVLEMDTPGGLDGSMRKIIQAVLDSPVPVITYVAPAGARAASAGAFIAVASHIVAMAPGTNIGAAHPVQIGASEKTSSVMNDKLTNDAVAYLRSIAQERGRDLEWVEAAVRESRSSGAEEAVELKIADFIARDREDLLRQAEGWQVKTVFGAAALSLKGKPLQELPVSLMEKILHQLAHPNLAYILLLLGIYGLIYELATPGAVFPGVVGAIFLVLALVALETLEVNWGGIALIALSLIFFIADIKLPGYGALTAGGIIAFALGSAILFPGARISHLKLPWTTIGAAVLLTAAFFLGIVGAGVRALRQKVTSGTEGLIGSEGLTKTDLRPSGMVHVKGEDWQARAAGFVRKGARVRVVRREGLTVHVEEVKESV
ncbi:MAG: nodulation protein NfeD [Candidatus Omnitrophota bacterium]|nr:nodulation protein NfeD [Candidatus Omnitrophota bacterium]